MLRKLASFTSFLLVLLVTWGVVPTWALADEFECVVSIDFKQLEGNRFGYLNQLQRDVQEYYNQNDWTPDRYQRFERISCNISIVFEQALSLTQFRARIILTSRRPIYGTSANTNILLLNDTDWQFEYSEGTPLYFEVETFNNLTSVLDFYGYVMLGYDADTFSDLGGTEHFQKARRIVDLAQSGGGSGWTSLGQDRSRGELITMLLAPRFQPVRQAYYLYHYEGLDHFLSNQDQARNAVIMALENLDAVQQDVSRNYLMDLFFSTKYKEVTEFLMDSSQATEGFNLLNDIDPSRLGEYNRLVQ